MMENQNIIAKITKKRDFRQRKWASKNRYSGKRKKSTKKLTNNNNKSRNEEIPPQLIVHNEIEMAGADLDLDKEAGTSNDVNMTPTNFEFSENDFISASKRKLGGFNHSENDITNETDSLIIQMGALNELINKGTVCMYCKQHSLVVNNKKCKGLASVLEIICNNDQCFEHNVAPVSVFTSSKCATPTNQTSFQASKSGSSKLPFIVNMKVVLASRSIGIGYDQLARFCAVMGLPRPLHKKSFNALQKKLHTASVRAMKKNLELVNKKISASYNEMFGNQTDVKTQYQPGEIGVMFDGTWQKRGHQSHTGVGVAIEIYSGYVLDIEALSNFCVSCAKGPKEGEANYINWFQKHKTNCQKNIDCSSHAMEVEAAKKIWDRSKASGLKYTTFLSDGDSKAYKAVVEMQPYGENIKINKEDCINHVSKRFGTALRKINPELPRGSKLSEAVIRSLSFYYQLALSNNKGDAKKMYNAVIASLLHCSSTDTCSNHRLCPVGEESWCYFQKAVATGEPPPSHQPLINEIQAKLLAPIYKRMSDIELLQRSEKGKTQNAAESFNSRLWNLCPKTRFASLSSVETALAISVLQFNRGMGGLTDVLQELQVGISENFKKYKNMSNAIRIKQMQHKMTAEVRQTRKKKKMMAAKQADHLKRQEGLTYYPGGLDTGMFEEN